MSYSIYPMPQYEEWLLTQTEKSKLQIEKRLDKVKEGHFGHIRELDKGLMELKFNDGRRIYYTIIPVNNVILLLGGGKNGQKSDINKAKNLMRKPRIRQKKEVVLRLEDFEGLGKEHTPSEYLTDPKNVGNAILECLENNDPEGVMEVIAIYLEAVNKSKLSQENAVHRQTIYSALRHKNPTVKTLAKIIHSSVI